MRVSRIFLSAIAIITPGRLAFAWQRGSAGCGKTLPGGLAPGQSSRNLTLESKSQIGKIVTRRVLTYLPEHFPTTNDEATPLILAFHGQTQPTWSMESITNLSTSYFNDYAVVAYPEGLNYKSPGQQWLGDPEAPPSSTVDDRIFAEELLDYLTSTFCVDESRIYAAGLSNGGGLTGLLACTPAINRRIAAFAGVAAAFYTDQSLTEPLFGAGCDPQLSYGRDNSPAPNTTPLPEWVDAWVDREGCGKKSPEVEMLDGGNVTRYAWSCGGWRDLFVHYKIDKFGHGWPSTAWQGEPFETLRLGPTTWNATSVILEWLQQWRLEPEKGLK